MNADTEARKVLDEIEHRGYMTEVDGPAVLAYTRRLEAKVATLEQRIAAARMHIDRARTLGQASVSSSAVTTELVMALDVLAGEAG